MYLHSLLLESLCLLAAWSSLFYSVSSHGQHLLLGLIWSLSLTQADGWVTKLGGAQALTSGISIKLPCFSLNVASLLLKLPLNTSMPEVVIYSALVFCSFPSGISTTLFWKSLLKVKVLVTHSCWIFGSPWTVCSPPGISVHGIPQARMLEWVAFPFSRGPSQSREGTQVF